VAHGAGGADISPSSIVVAGTCFKLPNLSYRTGPLAEAVVDVEFDLVVYDGCLRTYTPLDRPGLDAALKKLLSAESRLILTVPTPENQTYARLHRSEQLQPINEDIGLFESAILAEQTGTKLVYYRNPDQSGIGNASG
jgi:hypothetical protein